MSDHDAYRDDLPLYLTGDLDPGETAALEAHLVGCADCQEEQALLAETLGSLRRVGERTDPQVDLRGFYAERIGGQVGAAPRWPGLALRLAAAALLFLGGLALGRASVVSGEPRAARAQPRATPTPAETSPAPARRSPTPTPTPAPPEADSPRERAYRAAVGRGSGLARGLVALAELGR